MGFDFDGGYKIPNKALKLSGVKFKVRSPYREAIKLILKINSKSVNIVHMLETVYLVAAFADIPRRERLIMTRLVDRKKRLINKDTFLPAL